jgi:hypothetical protein
MPLAALAFEKGNQGGMAGARNPNYLSFDFSQIKSKYFL